jgi:S-formylglutathione hydrolase FrmB
MSAASKPSRTQMWMENLGDWSWPGQGAAVAAEVLPPPWVPVFPPRRQGAIAVPAGRTSRRALRARRFLLAVLLSALAAVCGALALDGRLGVERVLGVSRPTAVAATHGEEVFTNPTAIKTLLSLPTLHQLSQDTAGSTIDSATYPSQALHTHGEFLAYLPPGYASSNRHYPVIYMLTGTDQSDSAFLEIGLQARLDELIAKHVIPPLIAVMIQGGPGSNLWRNQGSTRYESYVLEVQELIDRTLPTVSKRDARAVVGDSMGAYGAMNMALANPYRFGVVESWLGFFNGLQSDLRVDRPIFTKLGLHAFIYGGLSDHIANPAEDAPFAAALRGAGAVAHSAVYPGEHNLATLEAHLTSMLTFAGRVLAHAAAATPSSPHA